MQQLFCAAAILRRESFTADVFLVMLILSRHVRLLPAQSTVPFIRPSLSVAAKGRKPSEMITTESN
jgi:hypothetical protein